MDLRRRSRWESRGIFASCAFLLVALMTARGESQEPAPVDRGLLLWLRADRGIVVDANGLVEAWEDQSQGERYQDALQNLAAERPVWVADGVNGQPVIRFDGVNDFLFVEAEPEFETDAFTWFVVFHAPVVPPGTVPGLNDVGNLLTNSYVDGAGGVSDRTWGSFVNRLGRVNSHARRISGGYVGTFHPQDTTQFCLLSAGWAFDDSITQYLNGVIADESGVGADAQPFQHMETLIGTLPDPARGLTRFFDGDIAEILIFNTQLADDERRTVEGYLALKYGLAGDYDFDVDGDGLLVDEELFFGTDPLLPDSDSDGLLDGEEVAMAEGSGCPDPASPDSDGDGLEDGEELGLNTDLCLFDTDSDGLGDGEEELQLCTDPLLADSDDDGLLDGAELIAELDPCNPDTDGDGIIDGEDPFPNGGGEVTPDDVAEMLRALAADIRVMDRDLFAGPGARGQAFRQHVLARLVDRAALCVERSQIRRGERILGLVHRFVDGEPRPRDWMPESWERDAVAADVSEALGLMSEFENVEPPARRCRWRR